MGLQTACPICHTVFKVDDKHLNSAQGMVQCGVCGMVFNASQHLQTTQTLSAADIPSTDSEGSSEFQIDITHATTEAIALDNIVSDEQPAASKGALSIDIAAVDAHSETEVSSLLEVDEPEVLAPIQFKKRITRNYKIMYFAATIVLATSLALQISIPLRHQITAAYPNLYFIYDTICGGQLCSMNTPYDVNNIELTNSSFEVDSKHKNLIKVTLSIQNNADIQLQYPRFALSLTDNEDNLVSIRKIYPSNYLVNSNKVLDAHEEQVIKLQISPLANNVTGYKLRLF